MGEFVSNPSEKSSKKQKKSKKHKLQDDAKEEQDVTERTEPSTKLRKPHAPMKKSRKKLKREERQLKEREEIFEKYKGTAAEYLESWKNDKSNWKFSKNIQNWIVTHLYDAKLLPDSVWPITLEYFAGSKGIAKINIIEAATKIIEEGNDDDAEQSANSEDGNEAKSVTSAKRAKDIIQFIVE